MTRESPHDGIPARPEPVPDCRGWVEVDLGAVAHNVAAVRSLTGPAVAFMAVVKADGYGHGAVPVARAALAAGARHLGVHTAEEGIALRRAGIRAPILVLGWTPPAAWPEAAAHDLTLSVFDQETAAAARQTAAAARATGAAAVHIKVDTGMGRLGYPAWDDDAVAAVVDLAAEGGLRVEGIYTHLAAADELGEQYRRYTLDQLRWFGTVVERVAGRLGRAPITHAANSAGAILYPEAHMDLVRIGIALYGLSPGRPAWEAADLRPALTWKTRVAQVKTLPRGTGISYGLTWVPDRETTVAVLAVGYADGYPRALSNQAEVLIGGRRRRVVGRVCMDQMMVTPADGVRPGDEVVLAGRQGDEMITVEDLAAYAGTIPHEVVTGIGRRVRRLYYDSREAQGARPEG